MPTPHARMRRFVVHPADPDWFQPEHAPATAFDRSPAGQGAAL